ncbi:MAG TPA: cytochrome d ubiquinol oxidase subunit II [Smithellaceae bacterium]|nr:cytochrome d ubiquinol oxidase subunit II [Smithellaceae bacterium]HRS89382.1 cytochrome d ubiquinol oxidase subunit II [Smithellaceae bacterium]HRV26587.1 cytochrome d ubiquinol oxidase subunit II [Smithellaceae bacterium]
MENIQNFQILWFILIAFLFLGYALLDGFDLGVGALLPFIGKDKEEKDILISSIGPVWDGNEVWLVAGAGALFAAFPQAYATALSGFYPAMLLVLCALIFRAVSMEFRAHDERRAWLWEKFLCAGSVLAALLFSIALGNAVYGVPLDFKMEFAGNFWTLLRPVPLLFGITALAAVLLQGASYAVLKTQGQLQQRCLAALNILLRINMGAAVIYFVTLIFSFPHLLSHPLFYAAVLLSLLGLAEILFSLANKNEKALLAKSSLSFLGLWLAAAAAHFPHLIKASNANYLSITIYNGSTGIYTLQIMSVIALIGMPLVIGYTIFVYRIFKGKSKPRQY